MASYRATIKKVSIHINLAPFYNIALVDRDSNYVQKFLHGYSVTDTTQAIAKYGDVS